MHKKRPSNERITVLGLNPHVREDGLIRLEEKHILHVAIKRAQNTGLHVESPVPADSFSPIFIGNHACLMW